ncbi:MAG: hypothetical protein ACI8V2_004141 [Candidatus Latescibacterota bacterium]|jgi:hypothetical protein
MYPMFRSENPFILGNSLRISLALSHPFTNTIQYLQILLRHFKGIHVKSPSASQVEMSLYILEQRGGNMLTRDLNAL